MPKLKSMKLSKAEKKEGKDVAVSGGDEQEYPWGLTLNLEDDTLKKLGVSSLEVGSTVTVLAQAKVTSVSSREDGEGVDASASLQITDMAVEEKGNSKKRAERMFPDQK